MAINYGRRASLLALLSMLPPGLRAESDFPTRPLRIVVGFPPGGSGDFIGRVIAEEMGKLLGQPVIVENRPGADTNIASEAVARSAPDGYSLLLGGSFSHSVNPAYLPRMPVDVAKDFTPIGKVAILPTLFAVPAALPVKTLQEFLVYARREGEKMNYGSAGSPGHIAGAYLNKFADLKMTRIPYKGAAELLRAVLAGEVHLIIASPPTVLPFVRQGKVKVLALTTAKSSPVMPGVPGAEEGGLKNFDIDGWYGLYGPARMPTAVLARLHGALQKTLQMPQVRAKFEAQGAQADFSATPEAFEKFGAEDRARWAGIVREAGVQAEK